MGRGSYYILDSNFFRSHAGLGIPATEKRARSRGNTISDLTRTTGPENPLNILPRGPVFHWTGCATDYGLEP